MERAPKTISVHLRIERSILEQIDRLAAQHDMSRTMVMMEAVREAFGIERKRPSIKALAK